MNQSILPMSKSEVKQLDFVLMELRNKYKTSIGAQMMSGGFSSASVLNFDNEVIMVEIKYGTQSDVSDLVLTKQVRLDRKTMEVIEKIETE